MGNYITATSDITAVAGDSFLTLMCGNGAGGTNSTTFAALVLDAEAEVDSILGTAFTVPRDTPIERQVKRAAADLFVFYAYETKPEFYRQDGNNPMAKRRDRAITTLKEIKSGERCLSTDTTVVQSKLTSTTVYGSNSTGRFIIQDDETDGNTGGF